LLCTLHLGWRLLREENKGFGLLALANAVFFVLLLDVLLGVVVVGALRM